MTSVQPIFRPETGYLTGDSDPLPCSVAPAIHARHHSVTSRPEPYSEAGLAYHPNVAVLDVLAVEVDT
jgi:hypothetical protein